MANETRERALKALQTPLEQLPVRELATLAGEEAMLLGLAAEYGIPPGELGQRLWSSEFTLIRARALVERAQHEIAREHAEAEARKERERGRRAGRRR